jgi:hypothetical protein
MNPATNTLGAIVIATASNPTLQENHPRLFSPRAGFAWSLGNGWVVRSAYGIFMVPISVQQNFNTAPPGYAISQTLQTTDLHTPIFQLSQGPPPYQISNPSQITPSVLNSQAINYWPYNAPQAYVQQWQFSLEKQLGRNTMVEASYVANKGTHLLFPRDLNQVPPQLLGPATPN